MATRGPNAGMATSAAAAAAATTASSLPSSAHTTPPLSPTLQRFAGNSTSSAKGRTGRPSSKFGTVNYSVDEMRRLNDAVRAVMPVGGDDWLHVAYRFNYLRPESIPYREVDSLKRKFKKMYCSRATTTTSSSSSAPGGRLPDYLEHAKELRRLLHARADRAQLDAVGAVATASANGDAEPPVAVTAKPEMLGINIGTNSISINSTSTSTSSAADVLVAADSTAEPQLPDTEPVATASLVLTPPVDTTIPTPTAASNSQPCGTIERDAPSTANIVALLQQSIARKRRHVTRDDDAAASDTNDATARLIRNECARVRNERKKRKVEQVLSAIHHEEQLAAAPLNVLELVLQFLVAQQREHANELERERTRYRQLVRRASQRRRNKERRRQRTTRLLVLAVAAALGDKCPSALTEALAAAPTSSSSSSDGSDGLDGSDGSDHDDVKSTRTAAAAVAIAGGSGSQSEVDRTVEAAQAVASSESAAPVTTQF